MCYPFLFILRFLSLKRNKSVKFNKPKNEKIKLVRHKLNFMRTSLRKSKVLPEITVANLIERKTKIWNE